MQLVSKEKSAVGLRANRNRENREFRILKDFEGHEMNNVVACPTATNGYEVDWRGKLDWKKKKLLLPLLQKEEFRGDVFYNI